MALSACISLTGQTAVFRSVAFDSSIISSNTESVYYKKYLHPIIHSTNFRDYIWNPDAEFFHKLDSLIRSAWEVINIESADYEITARNTLSDFFAVLSHVNHADLVPASSAYLLLEDRVQVILNF